MNTLAQPHIDQGASNRHLLRAIRAVAIAAIPGALAIVVALALRYLPVEGLVIAPRVMVPL